MNTSYKLDAIIKVDESLCIGCGSCIRCCPGGLITKDRLPVPSEDCGPIDIHLTPKWEEARQFLVSKRTIRGYINKPAEIIFPMGRPALSRHGPERMSAPRFVSKSRPTTA